MIIIEKTFKALKCWFTGHAEGNRSPMIRMQGQKEHLPDLGYYPYCKKCNKAMDFVMHEYWAAYIRNEIKNVDIREKLKKSGLIRWS